MGNKIYLEISTIIISSGQARNNLCQQQKDIFEFQNFCRLKWAPLLLLQSGVAVSSLMMGPTKKYLPSKEYLLFQLKNENVGSRSKENEAVKRRKELKIIKRTNQSQLNI
jgi:hypothetical protein